MDDCEYNPDEAPGQWTAGSGEAAEKKGDKPPKGGKGRKGPKAKSARLNPDFEDVAGYEGSGFGMDTEFAPPAPPPQTGQPPPMTFTDMANLSEEDCRDAILQHANENCCYGTKPAEEMKITNTMGITALHYKLETFTESRSTKKKKKPYMGGPVDGPENGTPPAPWAIPCQPKMLFKDDKIKIEVPHTAKVKKCKDCKGRGWETCDECDGWGRVECDHCDGSGRRDMMDPDGNHVSTDCPYCQGGMSRCYDCGGDGRVVCDDCKGYRKLKCFIQLKVKFKNHDQDYVLETSDLPDHLVTTVGGNVLFEQTLPMVWPVTQYPVREINDNSVNMVNQHRINWPNELIQQQRQVLRGVPVTEVHYKWDDVSTRFWVYGTERRVYAPDYPQQCCWGCSIL